MHRPPTVGADALGQRVETKTSNPLFAISMRPGKTGKDVAGVKGEVPVAISL